MDDSLKRGDEIWQRALDKARAARAAKLSSGDVSPRTPIERSKAKPKSYKLAIAAKCYQCEGEDSDVGWRKRIGSCQTQTCPLWPFRPYKATETEDETE